MKYLKEIIILILPFLIPLKPACQERSLESFLSDSSMRYASVSLCLIDGNSGDSVLEYQPEKSLIPASVLKLLTTASALELLGPDHTFRTEIGYTGTLNKKTGRLSGDIVIRGGGDPALGSKNFIGHYGDFIREWLEEISKQGIKRIDGSIITDDSYYDYQPVPPKWLWEDAGNYYGAGAYGLSVFDNAYEIHFKTFSENVPPKLIKVVPDECNYDLSNRLLSAGNTDKGYIFAAPYGNNGWIAGTIPVNRDNFILKASINDPPLLLADILYRKLDSMGIIVSGKPTTTRLENIIINKEIEMIAKTVSPLLKDIIKALNQKSINLYAEHLVKEIGRVNKNSGTTLSGIEAIKEFLEKSGIDTEGFFIEDGSGLSPLNSINSKALTQLLLFMKNRGVCFNEFYSSLPEAGKEGTLKNHFRDPFFSSVMRAKSGSMTRVISYAGYFTADSGRKMIFSIIINNYTGTSQKIISGIEEIIKEVILNK